MKLKLTILSFLLLGSLGFGQSKKQSGFLDDYSLLQDSNANKTMLSYVSSDFEKGKYKRFMLDDITIQFHKKAKGVKIKVDKLKELTDLFKNEIISQLEQEYELVDIPADDVALLQIAITDIVPGKVISNILPFSVAINSATGRGNGGASLEMKVVDSQTGQLLGQAMDNRKNRGYVETFSKFGNARAVFKYWAELLKERIDHYKKQ